MISNTRVRYVLSCRLKLVVSDYALYGLLIGCERVLCI